MKDIFLVIATIVTIGSVIPYVRDILKGSTKPNLVSWMTWTLLTGIATSAEIDAHEYVAAIFTGAAVVGTALVVVVGLYKRAYVRYGWFDVVCQVGAIVGIVLWQIFNSPAIGVIASVAIDFIGVLPTIKHSYEEPYEETWQTYALAGVGGLFGLLALDAYNLVSASYALYIVLINVVLSIFIVQARKVREKRSLPNLAEQLD